MTDLFLVIQKKNHIGCSLFVKVKVEFLSARGKVTASSSHPCILRYKSQPIRFVETIVKSPSFLAGFQSETQTLNVEMNQFIEGLEPTAYLKVMLESRAEYKSGAGIPEIYGASLSLESDLPRLKRLIWNWRKTIFVWTSIVLFFVELMFFLLFCRPVILPRGKPRIAYDQKEARCNIICWYRNRWSDQIRWWLPISKVDAWVLIFYYKEEELCLKDWKIIMGM